jgi:hypothetical protein
MDNTVEAVTFMATDVTNVCPVYGYKFPDFVPFMVTKRTVFPCHGYRRPHSFSLIEIFHGTESLFISTDFHRTIFGLPVGNATSISRTTLEYFMTIVHNMFYPFPFFSLPKINELQAEWANGLRSNVLTFALRNYLKHFLKNLY